MTCLTCGRPLPVQTGAGRRRETCDEACYEVGLATKAFRLHGATVAARATSEAWLALRSELWGILNARTVCRLTADAVRAIRRRRGTHADIAREYGVPRHVVKDLWIGRTYRNVV